MMQWRAVVLLLAVVFSSTTTAVVRSPEGRGQVLIYPYFLVQPFNGDEGIQTLFSLVNHSDQGKAVKLRFREALNGREVLAMNVYLGPRDVWAGAIIADSRDSAAQLITQDPTCTVPALGSLVGSGGTFRGQAFSVGDFTGPRVDSGPQAPSRTHSGYVEAIEMGTVIEGSATDQWLRRPVRQRDCQPFLQAWLLPDGVWVGDPQRDLASPSGGLSGTISLFEGPRSTSYQMEAVALEEFSVVIQHTGPHIPLPDLSSAVTDPARRVVHSSVQQGSRVVRSEWPPERAVDAVSAALAVETLEAEYALEPGIDGRSEWLLTMPTKRFYTDPALSAAVQSPFDPSVAAQRCSYGFGGRSYDREGATSFIDYSPPPPPIRLCNSVEVVRVGSSLAQPVLPGGQRVQITNVGFHSAGHLELIFPATGYDRTAHLSRPALGGERYAGVPVVATRLQRFVNNSARPGVSTIYGTAEPVRSRARCLKSVELVQPGEFRTSPCLAE